MPAHQETGRCAPLDQQYTKCILSRSPLSFITPLQTIDSTRCQGMLCTSDAPNIHGVTGAYRRIVTVGSNYREHPSSSENQLFPRTFTNSLWWEKTFAKLGFHEVRHDLSFSVAPKGTVGESREHEYRQIVLEALPPFWNCGIIDRDTF